MIRSWRTRVTLAALIALMSGCARSADEMPSSVQRELSLGAAASRAWTDSTSVSAAVSAGYSERLRLGLGSPYRLIDYALQDPRLDQASRTRVAWALLAGLRNGAAYEIDARVLDQAGINGARMRGVGAWHLRLAEEAVTGANEARAAELGIRMGYLIAEQEGLVRDGSAKLMAAVAALLTDRELALADADRLLTESSRPLVQLRTWRAERRFDVEQPRIGPVAADVELAAAEVARNTVQQLRSFALRVAHERVVQADSVPVHMLPEPLLDRLAAAHKELHYPPQTPVVLVARQVMRDGKTAWASSRQRALHADFVTRVTNEEGFALEYARMRAQGSDPAFAQAALRAAVALRTYAQEAVWFPGMSGPTVRELEDLYGLAQVVFEPGVPAAWKPYYRRMLSASLEDLYRVMPATSLRGLKIRFGAVRTDQDILAMHDPRQRRLWLPLASSAGTLAHELAHDIDWQQAVAKYRVHGDYATDRALRHKNDRFARRVEALRTASLNNVNGPNTTAHAVRPAEIFARNVDWYVSVALAKQGRRNGYLSSVQDEVLTGYGTVRSPDVSGAAGDAFMEVMNDVAPIYREERAAFRSVYGSARLPRSFDLVRGLAERSVHGNIGRTIEDIAVQRDSALRALSVLPCGAPVGNTQLRSARSTMIDLVTEARARGVALDHMQRVAGKAGRLALMEKFYGGPLSSDSALNAVAHDVAQMVKVSARGEIESAVQPFQLPGSGCSSSALF